MCGTPMVSIITPCYNGEKYVERFLDSILAQTYSNIELFFINDGSTDRTEKIVKEYIELFAERNIKLHYYYQTNSGQAQAINVGLKLFKGDYLIWPDSDDFLESSSIEKRVSFLEDNPSYGLIRSNSSFVDEFSPTIKLRTIANENIYNEKIFEDLILERTFVSSGAYMLRSESFLDVNPDRVIYPSRAGQNWQMLLPITYKYKCGYIDEALYNIVERSDSHSRSVTKLKDIYNRTFAHEDILVNTLNSIDMNDDKKANYLSIVKEKYVRKRFKLMLSESDKIKYEFNKLKENNYLNFKDVILYILSRFKLIRFVKKIN